MIKAVTFDMWNTLLEEKDYAAQRFKCLADALGRLGVPREENQIEEAYMEAQRYAHRAWTEENYRFVPASERLDQILKKLSARLTEDLRVEVLRGFEEVAVSDPPQLVEGVRDTLESLSTRYKMGIICDSGLTPGRVLRNVLAGHGLLGLFEATIFSDENGYNKPHITMFRNALTRLLVEPSEAVHVGDLLHTDVAGAKAAGMTTIWFDTKRTILAGPYKPDYRITAFPEVLAVLDSLETAAVGRKRLEESP